MFGPVVVLDGNGFRDETDCFQNYYNGYRSHAGLKGETPIETPESKFAELNIIVGRNIAAAYNNHQLLHEDELAMNTCR